LKLGRNIRNQCEPRKLLIQCQRLPCGAVLRTEVQHSDPLLDCSQKMRRFEPPVFTLNTLMNPDMTQVWYARPLHGRQNLSSLDFARETGLSRPDRFRKLKAQAQYCSSCKTTSRFESSSAWRGVERGQVITDMASAHATIHLPTLAVHVFKWRCRAT
jgi:hypothetical protein